jgi:hypothetical protein
MADKIICSMDPDDNITFIQWHDKKGKGCFEMGFNREDQVTLRINNGRLWETWTPTAEKKNT